MAEPMWEYWRDKKGVLEAVKQQYPEVIEASDKLKFFVYQAEGMLQAIDRYMALRDERLDGDA